MYFKRGEVVGKNNKYLVVGPFYLFGFVCVCLHKGCFRVFCKHLESRKVTTEITKGLNNKLCGLFKKKKRYLLLQTAKMFKIDFFSKLQNKGWDCLKVNKSQEKIYLAYSSIFSTPQLV